MKGHNRDAKPSTTHKRLREEVLTRLTVLQSRHPRGPGEGSGGNGGERGRVTKEANVRRHPIKTQQTINQGNGKADPNLNRNPSPWQKKKTRKNASDKHAGENQIK